MRGISLTLAALVMLTSGAAVAADAQSVSSPRIGLAMTENRQPLVSATRGLLSDGTVLLAFANVAAGDTSVTRQGVRVATPVLDQGAELEPLRWAVLLPEVKPADEGAEARRQLPLPEEEPCKLGLVCRESEGR